MQIACEATNPKLGRIIGGIGGGKRGQPRADYVIISELGGDVGSLVAGIQVKNYSDSMMTHIDINTDLGLIAPNIGQGFTDTIVNAQFNKDIASMAGTGTGSIDKFLKRYLSSPIFTNDCSIFFTFISNCWISFCLLSMVASGIPPGTFLLRYALLSLLIKSLCFLIRD